MLDSKLRLLEKAGYVSAWVAAHNNYEDISDSDGDNYKDTTDNDGDNNKDTTDSEGDSGRWTSSGVLGDYSVQQQGQTVNRKEVYR